MGIDLSYHFRSYVVLLTKNVIEQIAVSPIYGVISIVNMSVGTAPSKISNTNTIPMPKRIYSIEEILKCSLLGKMTYLNNNSPREHPSKTRGAPIYKTTTVICIALVII